MAGRKAKATFESEFTELSKKLSPDGKLIVAAMSKQLQSMEERFTAVLTSKTNEIIELQEEVKILRGKIVKIEENIDESDAYERRDTLIFSGEKIPEFSTGEICPALVHEMVKNHLKIELGGNAVSTAHRIGKKPTSQTVDRRPIIAKLCQRDNKAQILGAARKLRLSGFFVNESLTPTRRTLLFTLRKMKREHPEIVVGCSSFDGKVFAYTKPPSAAPPNTRNHRHLITTHEKLAQFCREHIKRPLEAFLESWPQ